MPMGEILDAMRVLTGSAPGALRERLAHVEEVAAALLGEDVAKAKASAESVSTWDAEARVAVQAVQRAVAAGIRTC